MPHHDLPSPAVTSDAPRRVLVVDDNRDATDSLSLLLQLEGYDVRVAYDGRQALDLVKAFEPEVVFLDINMPEMDGCTVAKKIRTGQAERPSARLATMSAYDCTWKCPAYDHSCHFDKHLGKPYDFEKVLAFLSLLKPSL
jgi:CheY-like chemotaxis protein